MSAPTTSPRNDCHAKALALNLDAFIYGTFAEIGAGQEVARWFLSVGAASGTVAKTICAYDKSVSDNLYGEGTRYVSRERLLAMLDREYQQLIERLAPTHGANTRFFVFADTVAARNYKGDNEQHGWAGIRFQTEPGSPPSTALFHVNLGDSTAQLQQQAIGTLGVNLVYASFHQRQSMDSFLGGLFDDLSVDRLEIDVVQLEGPAFLHEDARLWSLSLLNRKMARALVFNTEGYAVEPSSILRKRPLLVLRGTFAHPDLLDVELLNVARSELLSEGLPLGRDPIGVVEFSIHPMTHQDASDERMLGTIRQMSARGPLMVTDYPETYLLGRYLRRHTTEPVRYVLSVAAAAKIMHEPFYQRLPGTLLEGLGRVLATNVKLYVAPMPLEAFKAALHDLPAPVMIQPAAGGLVTLDDLQPPEPLSHLLSYLRASGRLLQMDGLPNS